MDDDQKLLLSYTVLILLGIALIFSNIPIKTNEISYKLTNATFNALEMTSRNEEMRYSAGITGEMIFATILLLSPFSIIGGFWYGRLAYDFMFGYLKDIQILGLPTWFSKIMAFLCMIVFIYSFIEQYHWYERIADIRSMEAEDKELAKFI